MLSKLEQKVRKLMSMIKLKKFFKPILKIFLYQLNKLILLLMVLKKHSRTMMLREIRLRKPLTK